MAVERGVWSSIFGSILRLEFATVTQKNVHYIKSSEVDRAWPAYDPLKITVRRGPFFVRLVFSNGKARGLLCYMCFISYIYLT